MQSSISNSAVFSAPRTARPIVLDDFGAASGALEVPQSG
jgi:hypothetical protein